MYFRFFQCDGLGSVERWEKCINDFAVENSVKEYLTLEKCVDIYKTSVTLSIVDQFQVISTLPNFHRWNVQKTHGVKMDEYFIKSSRSPRNRILKNYLNSVAVGDDYEEMNFERFL